MRQRDDCGSTIPLIVGFFLIALIMVVGSIALGQAFVQQRALQAICDGAAAAAAASAADLDRSSGIGGRDSLPFADAARVVQRYLRRDPQRRRVQVRAVMSRDRQRITLHCAQTTALPLGGLFGRAQVHHTAVSSARAAVLD